MITDNFPHDEVGHLESIHKENRLWIWVVVTFILFGILVAICSCNNAKHMAVTHPDGYWMHGKYLSNHKNPKNADTTIVFKR